MKQLVLTPAARADIDDIWTFTVDRWGVDQAKRYVRLIGEACHGLAAGTRRSRVADIRKGYRKLLVGSHVLYFREEEALLTIVRILHQSMDADRHL